MVEVLQKVRAIDGVEQAVMTYGVYDVVAKVKRDADSELKEILVNRIRKVENVLATLTMLVIEPE
jgi:DNA-binding Lrp family transcriptional regulator